MESAAKSTVHLEHVEGISYPQWEETNCYGPDTLYPELEIMKNRITLSETNKVYEMVRATIAALGMDKGHFGTNEWNPFSEFILPGETILVKPNMVSHVNGNNEAGTDCLVTHPSIVRAVVDYVILALRGKGRIILADAPVQSCDFDVLVKELHYDSLLDHYRSQNVAIELVDLRQLGAAGIQKKGSEYTAENGDVVVNLGSESAFYAVRDKENAGNLRITNYLPEYMKEYHNEQEHRYSIAKSVMEADVIINLPKPKTHRKAGITASLKNMIGCIAKKECLPHHTKGSKAEKGDEYLQYSLLKKWRTELGEKNDRRVAQGKQPSFFYSVISGIFHKMTGVSRRDRYTEGSWYGNDTLWRTICDVNRIIMYADKSGNLAEQQQRKMFILADMIVAGEKEGPLCPSPRYMGLLAGGWEQAAVDKVIAAVMGFSSEDIPSIRNAGFGTKYRLPENDFVISSNEAAFRGKGIEQIQKEAVPFVPTSGWTEQLRKA